MPTAAPPVLEHLEWPAHQLGSSRNSLARQLETSTGRSQPWFYYLGKLEHVPTSAPGYALETMTPELFARWPAPSEAEVVSYLDQLKPDLVVLELSARIYAFPSTSVFYNVLHEQGELVTTISGEGDRHVGEKPIDYQSAHHLAQRVLTADAFGPHLEIFRWPAH